MTNVGQTFKALVLWMLSMCWHLWRIATLRPAYKHLGDTGPVVFSFLGVFYVAGILRHWVLMPEGAENAHSLGMVIFGLLIQMAMVYMLFERKSQNSSLPSVILGGSAVVDLTCCLLFLIGAIPEPKVSGLLLIEIGYTAVLYFKFQQESPEVRGRAYKRKSAK